MAIGTAGIWTKCFEQNVTRRILLWSLPNTGAWNSSRGLLGVQGSEERGPSPAWGEVACVLGVLSLRPGCESMSVNLAVS